MSDGDDFVKQDTKNRVRQQLDRLTERQIEALRTAMVAGMTTREAREYDERQRRLKMLMKMLR